MPWESIKGNVDNNRRNRLLSFFDLLVLFFKYLKTNKKKKIYLIFIYLT